MGYRVLDIHVLILRSGVTKHNVFSCGFEWCVDGLNLWINSMLIMILLTMILY